MENMENVMNENVMTEATECAVNSGLGKKVAKGLVITAGVALTVKGAIWVGKKIKGAIASRKAKKAGIVVDEYDEVECEEA